MPRMPEWMEERLEAALAVPVSVAERAKPDGKVARRLCALLHRRWSYHEADAPSQEFWCCGLCGRRWTVRRSLADRELLRLAAATLALCAVAALGVWEVWRITWVPMRANYLECGRITLCEGRR